MSLNTEHLARCVATLESALQRLQNSEAGSVDYEIFRNATLKGFELSLEVAGKLLRKALKPYFGNPKAVDSLNYKEVLREAARHGLLSLEETERWFAYRDNRNLTAHDYGVAFAEETLALLPNFVRDARHLSERVAGA